MPQPTIEKLREEQTRINALSGKEKKKYREEQKIIRTIIQAFGGSLQE